MKVYVTLRSETECYVKLRDHVVLGTITRYTETVRNFTFSLKFFEFYCVSLYIWLYVLCASV